MKNGRIGFKLVLSFLIVIAAFAAVSAYQVFQMRRLQQIQNGVTAREADYAEIAGIQARTIGVSAVVSDAIINRDSEVTTKEWSAVKAMSSKDIARLRDFAKTDVQKRIADTFGTSYTEYLSYVDSQVLPLLAESDTAAATRRGSDAHRGGDPRRQRPPGCPARPAPDAAQEHCRLPGGGDGQRGADVRLGLPGRPSCLPSSSPPRPSRRR